MSEKRKSSRAGKAAQNAAPDSGSPMDVALLAQIVALMTAHDLNTVDVRDGQRRVILKRGAAGAIIQPSPPAPIRPASAMESSATIAEPSPGGQGTDESRYLRIVSPMVGTFYASPKPGEKPFVAVGAAVNEDSDVCIIEAMKTFNNIKAECHGTVARILVQDGQPVEFGTVLFLVNPS